MIYGSMSPKHGRAIPSSDLRAVAHKQWPELKPPDPPSHTSAIPVVNAGSSVYSCGGLEQLWIEAGGNPVAAFMAAKIAMAESGGNTYAVHMDGDGTVDQGLWQINSSHGIANPFNPYANAREAIQLSGNGANWSQWVTYTMGLYQREC